MLILATWPQADAWGRHNFSILEVANAQVGPGEEVAVSGFSYTDTVSIHLGSPDGPLLVTLEPTGDDIIRGTARIPDETPTGRHELFAVQRDDGSRLSRLPGRAVVTVVNPGGTQVREDDEGLPDDRPSTFASTGTRSFGSYLAISGATAAALGALTFVAATASRSRRAGARRAS